ncbi:MAG: MBL fold metallo-hydrolase [Halieaceae bacterium]|jgi:phosphoribosyl 1,2-cyclic phosphodiesterase|nr:MBL fold metallo-hydrolase [Halieaceae bacterium]
MLVATANTMVMIDCGFSLRETVRRLARLNVMPEQLNAILVTHEHTDHSSGVSKLSRKYQIPVYLTHGTYSSGRCDDCHDPRHINSADSFSVGNLEVQAVAVPHDAREPCQYRLSHAGLSLGVLTDIGSITAHVVDSFSDCDALVLECNHDLQMLMDGAYPASLKSRVSGDWGHLNNTQAAALLQQLGGTSIRHLAIAHISEKNNSRGKTEQALQSVLPSLDHVVWAGQSDGFDWLVLD